MERWISLESIGEKDKPSLRIWCSEPLKLTKRLLSCRGQRHERRRLRLEGLELIKREL